MSQNPDISLPPPYLIYESFQLNYQLYYNDSMDSAEKLLDFLSVHTDLKNKRILDWGCGPGRIIRHLPSLVGPGCEFYGSDYNEKSIEWCKEHLKDINFHHNSLDSALPFPDKFFDIIYGLSVLTHLSEGMHYFWYNELYRLLNNNGIILLTTQGDNYKGKLTEKELLKYNNGDLVVRGNTKEGHRTFSAFHPPEAMLRLFENIEILEHIERPSKTDKYLPQDVWILKKSSMF